MGFKPLAWVEPVECWAEPGHIYLKDYDGVVTDYASSIKVSIPKQVNDFHSTTALWCLSHEDTLFWGNNIGTYTQVDKRTNTILSCGTWDINSRPRTCVPCGMDENGDVCMLDLLTCRIVYVPSTYGAFVLHTPIIPGDSLQCYMEHYRRGGDKLTIYTDKGVVDLATQSTWVPQAAQSGSYSPVPLRFRHEVLRAL